MSALVQDPWGLLHKRRLRAPKIGSRHRNLALAAACLTGIVGQTMNILDYIDTIDGLVVKHSEPASVSHIRNQLTIVRQEAEAMLASNAAFRNENTVLKNTSAHKDAEAEKAMTEAHRKYAELEQKHLALQRAQTRRNLHRPDQVSYRHIELHETPGHERGN